MTLMNKRISVVCWLTAALVTLLAGLVVSQETKDAAPPLRSIEFQAADIRYVFNSLADEGGVNIVVAPEVTGSVTIKLREVTWRTAMDIIGNTYNLAVVEETSGYYRVVPQEQYRKEVSEREKHNLEQRQIAALETQIVKISNSNSADIEKAVKSLLTERGKATSDPRSNSIIIQEVPTNIQQVLTYITELDKPARQIKISAQLVEISSESLEEVGLKWIAEGTYTTESGRSYKQEGGVIADRNTDVAGRYTVTALQHGWSVEAIVEALVKDGKGKIIAHPEITTIDNSEAKIQMGQKVPIKQFDESGNVVTRFEEVGTILTVTPHITAENQVLMHLSPERSTYVFDPNGVIINTSNAETRVIVSNGQTAVIGGLTTQDEVESNLGVPVLKDIPLLGNLFRYKNKRTESRDLVIFVTPTIVDDNLAMKP
jgi:type IV pilus secretin PilQ/predicted competence protein